MCDGLVPLIPVLSVTGGVRSRVRTPPTLGLKEGFTEKWFPLVTEVREFLTGFEIRKSKTEHRSCQDCTGGSKGGNPCVPGIQEGNSRPPGQEVPSLVSGS